MLIDFDAGVEGDVGKELIFGLQTELVAKLAARLGTQNVVGAHIARRGLERLLRVVEDAIALQSAALKVPIVVVRNRNDLLRCLHLLHNLVVRSVKDLNVPLIKGHENEAIVADGIKHFELSRHFLSHFQLVGREEVDLHFRVLAD